MRVFVQQNLLIKRNQVGFNLQLALLGTASCRDDGGMKYGAHLRSVCGFDCVRIIPKIDAVDVFVVEPQPGVMRVIDAFARSLLEGITTSDNGSLGGPQWIENWFLQCARPNVRSESFAIDGDIHPALLLMHDHLNALERWRARKRERSKKHCPPYDYKKCASNQNTH